MTIAEKLAMIAENEQKVYDAGFAAGKADGSGSDRYDEGLADGKTAEYDRFWDIYQESGNRTNYNYGFGGVGWTNATFKPKYDIRPTAATHLFTGTLITDLCKLLNDAGKVLDFSNLKSQSYLAQYSSLRTLPVLDMRTVPELNYFLLGNTGLHTIEKIILKDDGSQTFTAYTFMNNTALKEIRFEGVIGQSGLNFKDSTQLSKESIESIVGALSSTASGKSITLSQTAVNTAFTTDEWNTLAATKTNWTITLI